MLTEINEMPQRAKAFLAGSPDYVLPLGVPYIGMGSSYFAPLCFKFMGLNIRPEIASEFANYLHVGERAPNGVLLSQSGRSTEVLWCAGLFQNFTAVTNTSDSPLSRAAGADNVIDLLAGEERYSSSKTYINTLLALFKGFDLDVSKAVQLLDHNRAVYEEKGRHIADEIYRVVQHKKISGIYITGSGPNIGTALQAALILSESTKLNFTGLPMAQYDHGPKETAKDSILIQIVAKGKSYERTKALSNTVAAAGAQVFEVEESGASEAESVLHNIIPFNYLAYYLSEKLGVRETFAVGAKVTEVKTSKSENSSR